MQNANLLNLPENYTFKYCQSSHPVLNAHLQESAVATYGSILCCGALLRRLWEGRRTVEGLLELTDPPNRSLPRFDMAGAVVCGS